MRFLSPRKRRLLRAVTSPPEARGACSALWREQRRHTRDLSRKPTQLHTLHAAHLGVKEVRVGGGVMGDVGWRQEEEGGGGVKRSVCTVLHQTLLQKPGSPSRVSCTFAVLLSGPRVPGGVCGETGVRRRTDAASFCHCGSDIRAVKLRNSKGDFSGKKDQSALI